MANRLNRSDQGNEGFGAMISMAGIRPVSAMASVSVSATSANSKTILSAATRRCLVLVIGGTAGDIRVTLNETADANDWPLIPDLYFSFAVEKDDTINVYNTTGSAVTVYFLELY